MLAVDLEELGKVLDAEHEATAVLPNVGNGELHDLELLQSGELVIEVPETFAMNRLECQQRADGDITPEADQRKQGGFLLLVDGNEQPGIVVFILILDPFSDRKWLAFVVQVTKAIELVLHGHLKAHARTLSDWIDVGRRGLVR